MDEETQKRYTLWLKGENEGDEPQELAKAIGSGFWTTICHLAEDLYGKENVYYTFGE